MVTDADARYALTDHLVHSDPIVQRFERWARSRVARGFSLNEAARAVGFSKRTLARRMQSVLGKSPLSYFQSLRVERAAHLLKTTNASVDEVAELHQTILSDRHSLNASVMTPMATAAAVSGYRSTPVNAGLTIRPSARKNPMAPPARIRSCRSVMR
jgi:AraC-like DNA-binding protein